MAIILASCGQNKAENEKIDLDKAINRALEEVREEETKKKEKKFRRK